MQQAVHPAEIDEHTVIRHVLHVAVHHRAFHQRPGQRLALGLLLFLQNRAMAHHHVAALAVQFQDAHFDFAVLPALEVVYRPQLDLRSGQKRAHADVDYQPALDPLRNLSLEVRVLAVGLLDPLPDAPPVRTHVRQQDVAVLLFVQPLDFDRLPFAELNWLAGIDEFLRWNQPFELSPRRPQPRPHP